MRNGIKALGVRYLNNTFCYIMIHYLTFVLISSLSSAPDGITRPFGAWVCNIDFYIYYPVISNDTNEVI